MISDCTPTPCELAVCFSTEIFLSGFCRNCLLSCSIVVHKNATESTVMRVNNKRKHAHQMRANVCYSTRFSTRVSAKIVHAFCMCADHLSLTCTVAKLQNSGPPIYISLNHKSAFCVVLYSLKGFDTCKRGGPKWPCIL